MIRLKNERELDGIRASGRLLSATLAELSRMVTDGIPTSELDGFARSYITSRGGRPSFLGYMNYPASLCVSVNNEVIHGIPGSRRLRAGDIVSLDLGVDLNGYFSDAALSVPVGRVSEARKRLLDVTRECLARAVAQAVPGNRVSDISRAVYEYAVGRSCGVVREYCGHGVGFAPHEDPQVPNFGAPHTGPRLRPGMVLAIEPMINAGTWEVKVLDDGWTVITADRRLSAHFEHTIAITEQGADILSLP